MAEYIERSERHRVFPCKVGDILYEPNRRGIVCVYKVISILISEHSIFVGWKLLDGIYSKLNGIEISEIGKTVFLTREEAEAALKGRQKMNEHIGATCDTCVSRFICPNNYRPCDGYNDENLFWAFINLHFPFQEKEIEGKRKFIKSLQKESRRRDDNG